MAGIINLNGKQYKEIVETSEDMVLVRCDRSGIFVGQIKKDSRNARELILNNCRRLWYWSGACSISQIANDGVAYPNKCKFPKSTNNHLLLDVLEIIPMTQKAVDSINSVKIWEC